MDFLDGSDDENGDVDQDVENVLLGSDDEEASAAHHHQSSRFAAKSYNRDRRNSEEEDDVLNLVLQEDEEPLDYDGDIGGQDSCVPPVKVRSSILNVREPVEHSEELNLPSSSNYDVPDPLNEDNFSYNNNRYVDDDGYDDGDDEEENRNTRSRFTSERNVESLMGGHIAGSSNAMGIPIQTVGDRKIRPGAPGEGRPKHWNHNGPRHGGPRHPGRNQRFPNPMRPGLGENHHMRPGMNQPIVQFNDGLFTDFNQPLRHPHPHPRMRPPPPGRFERNHPDGSPRPMGPHPNMRPGFHRPHYPQNENRFGPPRLPHQHGNMIRPQNQFRPPGPDFNIQNQRPPRYPPHNPAPPRPPHMTNGPHNPIERPQFHPRQHNPHFRPELPPIPGDIEPRHNNPQGFLPPPHPPNVPPEFIPQASTNTNPPPPRFMGYPRPAGPGDGPHNPYYSQEQPHTPHSYPPVPEPPSQQFHHVAQWNNAAPEAHPHHPNHNIWMQQQSPIHPQQNFGVPVHGYAPYYDQAVVRPQNPAMGPPTPNMIQPINSQHLSIALSSSHSLDIPTITKSIYIKPNSEIHEALSKGHLRHHLKEEDRRNYESSSHKHEHDDHYYRDRDRDHRERERSSSSRHERSSSDRRRDDDYYNDRKSYHYHERRPRRKYDDNDRAERRRSESPPEKKMSRSERSYEDDADRRREREEREAQNKETEKLLQEAKKMGLGEDYVKKLEEQKRLRERILMKKEQRRKQVKVPSTSEGTDNPSEESGKNTRLPGSKASNPSSSQKSSNENVKEIEADSTVASGKNGKPKKILRIVRDKSGKIISKKVHVVLVAKPQQEDQQSTSTS